MAIKASLVKVCSLLIEHGANVSSDDKSQLPPLYNAVATFDPDLVRLLLDRGASVEKHGLFDDPVSYVIDLANERIGYFDEHKFIAVIRLLVEAGADTTEISLTEESKKRFPSLQGIMSGSSNQLSNMVQKNMNQSIAFVHADREAIDPTEFMLKKFIHNISNESTGRYHSIRFLVSNIY
jgi:ankyrin repeat protein